MKKQWVLLLGVLTAVLVILALLTSAALKRKAGSVRCGNQMIAIGLAASLWSEDNGGTLPSNFSTLSNELNTLKILICPSDTSTRLAADWSSVTTNNASYHVVGPGSTFGTNTTFLRCPIHGYILRADGTVFDGSRQLRKT